MAIISQQSARPGKLSETLLLIIAIIIGNGAYILTQAGLHNGVINWKNVGIVFVITLAVVFIFQFILRKLAPYADPVIIPLVVTLNGIGLAMIYRITFSTNQIFLAKNQIIATGVGIIACLVTLWFVKDHRLLNRFTYLSMIFAFFLLLSPLIPGLGSSINGAHIWINIPFFGSFQPAELTKIFLAIFFAGYLTDQRDNLALAGPKVLGLHLPRLRHFGPIVMVWALAVAVLVLESDFGTSLLLFGLFLSMLYVATNRVSWVIIGLTMLSSAALVVSRIVPHIVSRFAAWLHPFNPVIYNRPYGNSQQIVTGLFGMASGGLLGTGWGDGMPQITPLSYSDYIFTALAEELGLTGALAILCFYLLIAMRGLRTAFRARDSFGAIIAAGVSFIITLQVFVVVGGVTRIIPVTGLTLPFLAHGGSALLCNWIMIALLLRISDTTRRAHSNQTKQALFVDFPDDKADSDNSNLSSLVHKQVSA